MSTSQACSQTFFVQLHTPSESWNLHLSAQPSCARGIDVDGGREESIGIRKSIRSSWKGEENAQNFKVFGWLNVLGVRGLMMSFCIEAPSIFVFGDDFGFSFRFFPE